jgi:hypothetical protein
MAGRSSTLITEAAAGMIYQNTSSSVQVCSINLCSTVETINPSITIKLHTANNVSLNQAVSSSTPGGNVTRFLDGGSYSSDTWGTASKSFYFETPNNDAIRYAQGTGAIYGQSFDSRKSGRYTCIDPWMFINPSDYFDGKVTTYPFQYFRGATSYWWLDGVNHWPFYNELWIEGNTAGTATGGSHPGNTATSWQHGESYAASQYPMCFDWYTGAAIGTNANSYMGAYYPVLSNGTYGASGSNTTTSSTLYDAVGGPSPQNYIRDTPFCKMMQAERGIFVVTAGTHPSRTYAWFNPVTNNSQQGYQMTGPVHFTEATNTNNYSNNMVTASSNFGVKITMNATEDFQWIKYNKTAAKYYICSKSEGIFSFSESDFWKGGSSYQNSTGFGSTSWLKYVGSYPFGQDSVQQPSKIGQNLWVTCTDQGVLYYSTDLISWKTAAQYLESLFPALPSPSSYSVVGVNNKEAASAYYFGTGSWNKFESGIDSVPNSGLLEKSEQAGTFERTGVILAPGDCIYVENAASNAKVGATVMYVEV